MLAATARKTSEKSRARVHLTRAPGHLKFRQIDDDSVSRFTPSKLLAQGGGHTV
jgi:hypothetical protein